MRASHDLTRVSLSFTETNWVPNAGLVPAAALAQRIGPDELVDQLVRLASEGANSGAKALTVVGSMLPGGDSIDDTALLSAGAAGDLFDNTRAPSTVGCWLRAHKWSNVRELDALARRSGLPVVSRFAEGMAVAIERGTPLSGVLHAQATDVREAGRRALIESGARKEIAMMVPVVFLVLPVTVIFAFWPGVVGLNLVTP